jgi:hypothetical protein
MDFNTIKKATLSFLQFLWDKIKETLRLPYAKTYILSSLGCTIIFIFLTFPYGEIIKTRIQKLGNNITIGDLDLKLIGTSTASDLIIPFSFDKELIIKKAEFKLNINPYSLLVSKHFVGTIGIKGLEFSGGFGSFSSEANGNVDVTADTAGRLIEEGNAHIMLSNANLALNRIELPQKLGGMPMTLPPMRFTSIDLTLVVSKNNATIEKFSLAGPDFRGNINGSIRLSKNIFSSSLDLTISIESESPVLENYKDFFSSYINADGNVIIPVRGNIMNPSFNPEKQQDGETTDAVEEQPGKDALNPLRELNKESGEKSR